MTLTDEERKALVEYRIERAYETWEETRTIISQRLWYAAANRMYYTCYYLTSALLISHKILEKKGMPQKDFARLMGKTETEISRWLSGTHNMTMATIAKISAALGENIIEMPRPRMTRTKTTYRTSRERVQI